MHFKKLQPTSVRLIVSVINKMFQYQIFLALTTCILLHQTHPTEANTHSVQTYRQSSTQLGQLTTSSTLVWESFTNDKKQLEYAIKGGHYLKDDVKIPIYVCRANVQGMYISGHTEKREKNRHICIVSQSNENKIHRTFDLLVNKGHLGKITWKPWNKFTAATPIGAIAVTMTNSLSDVTYIARHRNEANAHKDNHNQNHDADYNLGRFDPSVGFGKIIVTEHKNELQYDNGEILIETEPFKYELKDIIIDKTQMETKINRTKLGSGKLENTDEIKMMVETVISYDYDKIQYWGNHEGVARGLPTTIFDEDENDIKENKVNWGLRYSKNRTETRTVSTILPAGIAINVTLKGDYTIIEAPYKATLIAYYEGNEESVKRQINAVVQKSFLKDISPDLSPMYWIENGTIIPSTNKEPVLLKIQNPQQNFNSKSSSAMIELNEIEAILIAILLLNNCMDSLFLLH